MVAPATLGDFCPRDILTHRLQSRFTSLVASESSFHRGGKICFVTGILPALLVCVNAVPIERRVPAINTVQVSVVQHQLLILRHVVFCAYSSLSLRRRCSGRQEGSLLALV